MAVTSAELAKEAIQGIDRSIRVEIKTFVSDADRISGDLKCAGGKGLFTKDLERRLLAGEIDCALHTLKDLPGDVPMHPELMLISFLKRQDPRDALVLRRGVQERDLVQGVVGTSAPRRTAVLNQMYPGAKVSLCRGNADTRIRQLDEGRFDAIVLAAAGLERLELTDRVSRYYSTAEMLPAVGQGIVCLQVRRADADRCPFLREVNDLWAETAAQAERSVLSALQGNCHSAIAAHCFRSGDQIVIEAAVFSTSGEVIVSTSKRIPGDLPDAAVKLGHLAAAELITKGAQTLL